MNKPKVIVVGTGAIGHAQSVMDGLQALAAAKGVTLVIKEQEYPKRNPQQLFNKHDFPIDYIQEKKTEQKNQPFYKNIKRSHRRTY